MTETGFCPRASRRLVRSGRRSSPLLLEVGKYVVSLLGATESASRTHSAGKPCSINARHFESFMHLQVVLVPLSLSLSLDTLCAIARVRMRVQLRCARACSHIDRTARRERSRRDRARSRLGIYVRSNSPRCRVALASELTLVKSSRRGGKRRVPEVDRSTFGESTHFFFFLSSPSSRAGNEKEKSFSRQ